MKYRLVPCIFAVALLFSFLVTPAAAWTGESFLADSQNYYEFAPVQSYSVMSTSTDEVSLASGTSSETMENLIYNGVLPTITVMARRDYSVSIDTTGLQYDTFNSVLWNGSSPDLTNVIDGMQYYWPIQSMSAVPENTYSSTYEVSSEVYIYGDPTVTFEYDLPGTSNVLELVLYSGDPNFQIFVSSYYDWHRLSAFDVYLDDVLVRSYVGDSFDESFIYSSKDPVSTLKFVFHFSTHVSNTFDSDYSGSYNLRPYLYLKNTFLGYSYLTSNTVLDGYNDQAQDDINQHNAYESEWTGSMTTNFNQLSLSDFTFPDGLTSGFGLITGIFNDLWNGMGEYKIAYVFPLTLGVVLLLIGRISKFGGGRSSSSKGKGDSSA